MTTPVVYQRPDLVGPVALNVVGVGMVVAASIAAAGEAVASQIPFVNLGVTGVITSGVGNALYLFGWRRAIRHRRAVTERHPRLARIDSHAGSGA